MGRGLSAAVAAIACVTLVQGAQAQEKVKLRYGQIANSARSVSSLALVAAQRKGFLAKEGIELEIVGLRGVQYQIEELDKGTVDISHTATPYLIQLALKGSPSVAIVGGPANTIFSLIAKPEIKKRNLNVEPLSGEEVQRIVEACVATPKELVDQAKRYIGQ